MKEKFLITFDDNTAALLLESGFTEILNSNKSHTFINDQTLKFDNNIDINKINFSNMLSI